MWDGGTTIRNNYLNINDDEFDASLLFSLLIFSVGLADLAVLCLLPIIIKQAIIESRKLSGGRKLPGYEVSENSIIFND